VLICICVPIQLVNVANHAAALLLASGGTFSTAFSQDQLDGLTYLFVRLHAKGLQITQIFWGLWLIPWSVAALRSAIMPRWLAVALMAAGLGYMMKSAVSILALAVPSVVSSVLGLLALGEIATIVWLLGWGSREPRTY
jgi:hypothetical protein